MSDKCVLLAGGGPNGPYRRLELELTARNDEEIVGMLLSACRALALPIGCGETSRVAELEDQNAKLAERRDRWRKRAEDAEASLKVADAASDVWKHVADQIDAARAREREEARAEIDKLRADFAKLVENREGWRKYAEEAERLAASLQVELEKLRPASARERFDRAVTAAQCGCADALQRLPELAMQMMAEARKPG